MDNHSLAWSYDGANRVATAETVAGPPNVQPAIMLTHEYDTVGNRTGLTHGPDAVIVDGAWGYLHDGDGNLTRVTMPTTEIVDLAYDAASRLERITSANTVEMQVLYDVATGRPGSITHSLGAATLASFGYGFDTDGKILSIADGGGTRDFTYDATLQVTGGGYAGAPESYAYDPEGNRLTSHLSASYTHDAANRLRQDAETCYAYDANGNLATRTVKVIGACTGAVTAFEWDVLNRLVRIDNPDATYVAYRYDAQGRRIEKDVNTSLTRYLYDDDAILLEYDGADALQATYSHGEEVDQPLAMTRGGQSYFYHIDHLGSVRLLTDAAGAVANRYDYDSFGNLEATSFETVTNPFGFTARERDAESGLMFYRARYYDPKIGRFISEDPIGFEANDLNLYRYVHNNPGTYTDPTGNIAIWGYGTVSGLRYNEAQSMAALTVAIAMGQTIMISAISSLVAQIATAAAKKDWDPPFDATACANVGAATFFGTYAGYTSARGKGLWGVLGATFMGLGAIVACVEAITFIEENL